jgi:MFS family permease
MANLALNLLLDAQGVDNTAIGYVNALIVAGTITVALPLGYSSGRLGRRRVLLAAATTVPIALIMILAAPPGPTQMVGAFLLGASETIYFTTGYPHMAENSPAERRFQLYARSASLYYAGMFSGYLFCGALSVAVKAVLPEADAVTTFRVILAAAAGAAALGLLPLLGTGPAEHPEAVEPLPESRASRSPVLLNFVGLYVTAGLGTGALTPFVQLFLTQQYSMSVPAVGVLLGCAQLITALGTLLSDRLVRRFTAPGALLLTQVLVLPFTMAVAYGSLLPVVVSALVTRGLLCDMQEPILNGQVMARVAPGRRSAAATVNQAGWLVGLMIGSAASGVLQERGGWESAFSITVASSVVLCAAFVYPLRRRGGAALDPSCGPSRPATAGADE